MATLLLPRLGETMDEGRVVGWLKQPGEAFRRGETIVEIETDKTVVEMPALADGVMGEILAAEGAMIAVGEPLCTYTGAEAEAASAVAAKAASAPGVGAAMVAASAEQAASAPMPTIAAMTASAATDSADRVRATPLARRIARQNGVDIAAVPGSGRRQRIQAADVEAFAASGGARAGSEDLAPIGVDPVLFADLPQGRMAFRVWTAPAGTELPLVLLHGFAGDGQTWGPLAAGLVKRGRTVLAPDLPGHGATAIEAVSLDALADAVIAWLGKLGLGAVELVGHSLGGAVAARAATRMAASSRAKPAAVDGPRVTLIAPAGLGSEIDADFIAGMAEVATGGGLAHLLRRIALRPRIQSARQLDAMARALGASGLAALASLLVSGGRQQIDLLPDLAALTGRVRLVWGLDDRIIPWSQAVRAGAGVPVHFIPEAGHMPQWDQPQALAALLS